MEVTPIQLMIALGRKLEALYAQDRATELSEEALASDHELELLLQYSINLSNCIQALGYEPLNLQSLTQADLEILKQAIVNH